MACEISYRFWQLACVSSVSERSCTSVGGSTHQLLGLREKSVEIHGNQRQSVAISGSAHQLLGLREHEHANVRLGDAELLREGPA